MNLNEEQAAYRAGQPLDTQILTPDGWCAQSSLSIGDRVVVATGKTAAIASISPVFLAPILRFDFSDGAIAHDVRDLVRSLGGIAIVARRKGTVLPQYCVSMRFPDGIEPFALKRKAAVYSRKIQRPWRLARTVLRVTDVGLEQCRSIALDGPDHTYITQDYVLISDDTQTSCERSKFTRRSTQGCPHGLR